MIYNKYNVTVLLKGGHLANTSNDLLYDGNETWFEAVRIDNPNTHGTGCTFSAAIAAGVASGLCLQDAAAGAKRFVYESLRCNVRTGRNFHSMFPPGLRKGTAG